MRDNSTTGKEREKLKNQVNSNRVPGGGNNKSLQIEGKTFFFSSATRRKFSPAS